MSTRDIIIAPALGRRVVQEQSEQSFTVRFLSNRALSAPTTARWKLSSLETGVLVQDWTAIATPASEETVTVTGDLNTIRNGGTEEEYELMVQSDYADTSLRQTKTFRYKVADTYGIVP